MLALPLCRLPKVANQQTERGGFTEACKKHRRISLMCESCKAALGEWKTKELS